MRLLHTSDWHLGQTLHDFERDYEHQCFLDWLLNTLETEQIDALLIAGDIFDTSNPSATAQKQLYRFLTAANQRVPHLDIMIIAGNHDSSGRLEAPGPLLDAFNTTVVGSTRNTAGEIQLNRLVVPLKNRDGEITAWCLAIPFLRPGDVPRVETPGDPYLEGVRLLYRQALDIALRHQKNGQAIIALGHCHMHGGKTADSERRIILGGAEALPVDIFDPVIAYVALGHLHRAQKVGSREWIRYCGSPLPMSFTEIDYKHQVLCIDLDGESVRYITSIRVPRFVDLLRVPAQPAPIHEVLEQLMMLDLQNLPLQEQPYLQARVLLNSLEPGLHARIEAVLSGKPVRLARTEPSYKANAHSDTTDGPQSLNELGRLQPEDIFQKLYRERYSEEPTADLMKVFKELLLESDEENTP